MATAKEMGFKPGDIAIYASAQKRNIIGRGVLSGIPLDIPGAEVKVRIAKVEAVDVVVSGSSSLFTNLHVLWSNDDQHDPVGSQRRVHGGFSNYIGGNDKRLALEMSNIGMRIQSTIDDEGKLQHTVVFERKEGRDAETSSA